MSEEFARIEERLADFQYVDADHDRIVLSVGFAASFYFWGGHTKEKRQALADCVEAYEAAYGKALAWGCQPDSWKTLDIGDKRLPRFRDYVASLDEDDAVEWHVASGTDDEEASEYALSCHTARGWMEGRMSSLRFRVPRAFAFDPQRRQALLDLLLFCQERLAPFHGHAGLGMITTEQQIEWEPEEFDLATRYLALYASDSADLAQAQNGIKSVDWLTFIGDTLAERIGGPAAFAAYCERFEVSLRRHGAGFVVQAGPLPCLGPAEEAPPPDYVQVNAALRPLRNGHFGAMGTGSVNGERRFDRCTSDLWIRRFDQPGTWPPAGFTDLSRQATGRPPGAPSRLAAGQACGVHGRYRPAGAPVTQDDDTPQVVLLPGDVAPYWLRLGPRGEYLARDATAWELVAEL